MPTYKEREQAIAKQWMEQLARKETKEYQLLAKKWVMLSQAIQKQIDIIAKMQFPSENQLYKSKEYKQFLEICKQKIEQYNQIAEGIIIDHQKEFGLAGLAMAQQQMLTFTGNFHKLNEDAVNLFIGKSAYDGSPLKQLLQKSYGDQTSKITDTLTKGIALGWSPTKTTKEIRKTGINIPLSRSMRIARYEQLQVFRESSLMQYRQSKVVKMWEWMITNDDLVCDECRENDGKRFDLDTPFSSHPNCRCTTLSVLGGE